MKIYSLLFVLYFYLLNDSSQDLLVKDPVRSIHAWICAFGTLFLSIICFSVKRKEMFFPQYWGILFLALALLAWLFSDIYTIVTETYLKAEIKILITVLFSIFNKAFLITALPYFKFSFNQWKQKFPLFGNGKNWGLLVLIVHIILVLLVLLLSSYPHIIEGFNHIYTILVFSIISYVVIRAFQRRQQNWYFGVLGTILACFLIGGPLLALLGFKSDLDLLDNTINLNQSIDVLKTASEIILISLFLVLAQSWVVEEKLRRKRVYIKALEANQKILEHSNYALREQVASYESSDPENPNPIIDHKASKQEETHPSNYDDLEEKIKKLTPTERKIFWELASGDSYKVIAQKFHNAESTIITHVRSIENKLRVKSKLELEKISQEAIKLGIKDKLDNQ